MAHAVDTGGLFTEGNLTFFQHGNKFAVLVNQTPFLYLISPELYTHLKKYGSPDGFDLLNDLTILKNTGYTPVAGLERFYTGLNSITLTLMYGCNMSCTYCCVGPAGSYKQAPKRMSPETARRAMDFLVEHSSSDRLNLNFFGGEPLLNWPAIDSCLKYSRVFSDRRWTFYMTTNGTLITKEIAQSLAEYDVRLVITIDGPAEMHNKQRPLAGGKPSFDMIINNLALLRRFGVRFSIKSVYTKDSPLSYDELRKSMEEIAGDDAHISITIEHSIAREEKYRKLTVAQALSDMNTLINGSKDELRSNLSVIVWQILAGLNNYPLMCSAGWKSAQITPDGDITMCHISEYLGKFSMGNVYGGFNDGFGSVRDKILRPLPSCRTCWASGLCKKECNLYTLLEREKNSDYDADPAYCNMSMDLIEKAVAVVMNMSEESYNRLLYLYANDSNKNEMQELFRIKEEISKHLAHIKPCFVIPVKQTARKIVWDTTPA